jgi:hypothetical protein
MQESLGHARSRGAFCWSCWFALERAADLLHRPRLIETAIPRMQTSKPRLYAIPTPEARS